MAFRTFHGFILLGLIKYPEADVIITAMDDFRLCAGSPLLDKVAVASESCKSPTLPHRNERIARDSLTFSDTLLKPPHLRRCSRRTCCLISVTGRRISPSLNTARAATPLKQNQRFLSVTHKKKGSPKTSRKNAAGRRSTLQVKVFNIAVIRTLSALLIVATAHGVPRQGFRVYSRCCTRSVQGSLLRTSNLHALVAGSIVRLRGALGHDARHTSLK